MWEDEEKTPSDETLMEDAVAACCQRFFSNPDNKVVTDLLKKIAFGAAYAPGNTPEKTAWADGKRTLAVFLLYKGGIL